MTTDHTCLNAALAAFQKDMPTVPKSKTARVPTKSGGEFSYTYADLADVTAAAMPLLAEHGLAFTAQPRAVEGGGYELAGALVHEKGERIEGALPLNGRTSQEIGSALTYARRYLLGCLTGIVTDDDDDGQAASDARPMHRQARPKAEADMLAKSGDDPVARLYEAMNAATTVDELRAVYTEHSVGSAPEPLKVAFNARLQTVQAAEAEKGNPDAEAAAEHAGGGA